MKVRLLDIDDAGQYRALRLKGLKTDPGAFGSTYEQEVALAMENFEDRLVVTDNQFIVGGFDGNRLICVASFVRRSGPKSNHKGSLQAMYCDEEYRGKGISKEVVSHLIKKVKEIEGVEQISLAVVTENVRAKAFYEAFGFKTYGTEPRAMFDGEKYYDEHKMILQFEGDGR